MKEKLLKKGSILIVTTALVGSQLTTFSPAIAQATKGNEIKTTYKMEIPKVLKEIKPSLQRVLAVSPRATEVPVDVSTPSELEQALSSESSINVIRLKNDITLLKDLKFNKSVRIEGNGFKLSFSGKKLLMSGTARIDLQDVSLFNGSSNPMFDNGESSATPTINILGDVISSGYLFNSSSGGTLTIAGKNNSLSGSESSMIANVNEFKVEDNAQIKKMEAVKSAVKVASSGTISIGKNAEMNIRSNEAYAFEASESTLSIGQGATMNASSLYGAISVNALQIENDAKLDLSSGNSSSSGAGVQSVSGIKSGDNVTLKVRGAGTGIKTTSTSSVVDFGQNNAVDIQSSSDSGINSKGLTVGKGSDLKVNALKDAVKVDASGVNIGEISNQPVEAKEKNKVEIVSGNGSAINSTGNISLGDNTEYNISGSKSAILAGGSFSSNVITNLGSHSDFKIKSDTDMGINTGTLNVGKETINRITAKTTGINLGKKGNGLNTNAAVKIYIHAANGIISGKNLTFNKNNILDINTLAGNGINTTDSSKISFANNSLVKIQAKQGIYQAGPAANLGFETGSSLQIYNTEQHGVSTEGSINFAKNTSANIRAAQVGAFSAVKASGIVRFDSGSKIVAQTLSNLSTSVFDLSGRINSQLEIINPSLLDIKQGNHFEPGKGRLIKGYSSTVTKTRLILDSIKDLHSWDRGQAWGTAPSGSWKDVTSTTLFVDKVGDIRYDYFGGPTTGQNSTGFDIFDYSRLSTRTSNSNMIETKINELTTTSTVLTGTAEPGADVEIKVGDKVIGTGTADASGNYRINIPVQKEGTEVTAQAYLGSDKSNIAKTVVKGHSEGSITPNEYEITQDNITGSYTGDVVKGQLYVNGKYVSTGGTFKNGKFMYYVKAGSIKAGDKVEIIALDKNGKQLDRKPVQVKSATKGNITPNNYTIGQTNITGSYTGSVVKGQLYVNGKYVSTGGTFKDGKFMYYVKAGSIKAGDKVEIIALDKAGKQLDRKPVQVINDLQGNITPNDYTIGQTNITGSYTGDVVKGQLYVNGKYVSTGGTFSGGQFTYYVKAGSIKTSDKVEIIALDKNGKELDRKLVQVKAISKGSITPNEYVLGQTNITGSYSGDIVQGQLYINGKYVSTGGAFKNGKFTYYVKAGSIKAGDKVEIVALDKNGKELDRKPVQVMAATKGSITPDDYVLGQANITGSYSGDIAQGQLYINGKYVSTGGAFKNGKFTYYVKANSIKDGDKIEIVALDKNGKQLDRKPVSLQVSKGSITPTIYTLGSGVIEGHYTGDVAKAELKIDGKHVSWGGEFSNGKFKYYVKSSLIKKGQDVKLIALNNRDKVLDTKKVEVKEVAVAGKFTSATYKFGDEVIKGTYTGDMAIARVYVNGVPKNWGGEFNVGAFSYYLGSNKIKKGDKVTIEGYSTDKQKLDTRDVQLIQ
ncbi:immunoglobulin-like domain-containing protein [Listeria aquatica]|uniref:immunoglobulin-like domain-containing protein n=1 Tax=Listeria aquatica TaxID=1494960 RepID=UPI003F6F568F